MRKAIGILFLVASLLALPEFTLRAEAEMAGTCPDGFHAHLVSDMEHEHDGDDHLHAGVSTDLNGDGWICVKHVSADGTVHVHVDNNAELP